MGRHWSVEELTYLEENWGKVSIPVIAKNVNRKEKAVISKASRLNLGRFAHSTGYVTFNQVRNALGLNYKKTLNIYLREGCPMINKKVADARVRIIDMHDFWKWAEKNKRIVNLAKLKPGELGPEPSWVGEKRYADIEKSKVKKTPWTKSEDNQLIFFINQYRYSYTEIAEKLCRTEGAVKRRLITIKYNGRPLRNMTRLWSDEEVNIITDMYENGYSYEQISNKLENRSAESVRGKLERIRMTGGTAWAVNEKNLEKIS